MAKITKATREVVDVDEEIRKVTAGKKNKKENSKTEEKKEEVLSKTKKEKNKKKETSRKKKDKKEKKDKKKRFSPFKFFKEVKKEMSKVKWPSRKEMVQYSIATITFIIFFGIFFYVIEIIMALLKAWV